MAARSTCAAAICTPPDAARKQSAQKRKAPPITKEAPQSEKEACDVVSARTAEECADEGAAEGPSTCPWVEDAQVLAGVRVAPHPEKYHSDDISSFVANAAEVSALLGASSGRPTWEQVAAEARLDKTMLARPPGLKHSV